ncbi:MAG: AAA family ATPase [Pseudomonadota bacterium]
MSVAGIRSNRGDAYQTLVAFDWALTVLSDQDYQWLEIDSITYSVDDVVVGKTDGKRIASQCKKNQVDFKAWTITDLGDELGKAVCLLANDKNTEVRFYSRNNFGDLAKLKEHSSTQHDEPSYQASLSTKLEEVDRALSSLLSRSTPTISAFEFLRRTRFVTTDEFDRMETVLRERLRNMVSNPDLAFNALWTRLDHLGARMDGVSISAVVQHRLTRSELESIIRNAGALLVPPMNLAEIRASFSSTSAIGRSWRRDIAGQRISTPIVSELLAAIDSGNRSILLTGLPGSGKTCAMLELQEALEARAKTNSNIVPLFIQSREFADLATSEDRQAQGLSEQWVEKAARIAENTTVVVVMDSLDVLSIARDHRVLSYFLAQVDRLLLIPNITVVTACRDFDKHYDRRVRERRWDRELKCLPLIWDTEIAPLLEQLGISVLAIDKVTRELIKNPRELALFVELALQEGSFNVVTSQALAQRYLDIIVGANTALGEAAIKAIEAVASEMLKLRTLVLPKQRFIASQEILRELRSLNVLQETQNGGLTFGHQTLLDVLVISGVVRNGVTLNEFIQALPPVPFVRPSIRSFVAQLVLGERREFRKQIRMVLTGSVAFHIRRLVAESFAEQLPLDEDWPLLRDLREKHRDVFLVIYTSASATEWHHFWLKHLVPILKSTRDVEGLAAHSHHIEQWSNDDSAGVLSFWTEVLELDYLKEHRISDRLAIHLSEIKSENMAMVAPLLGRLLELPFTEHSFLGRTIARCVNLGVADDTMLWHYITDDLTDEDLLQYSFDSKLRCHPHEFGDSNENFLRQRMTQSPPLLSLALGSIERWSEIRATSHGEKNTEYRNGFLRDTSFDVVRRQGGIYPVENLNVLLGAVESSLLHHAKTHSDWWQRNRERLCFNHEGALLYFAVLACTASPEANIELIGKMLCDVTILEFEFTYEVGELVASAFRFLAVPVQDEVVEKILTLWSDGATDVKNGFWVLKARAELIVSIPRYLRSPDAQAVVDTYEAKAGALIREPHSYSQGGVVGAPFSFEVFLGASDASVLALLAHYHGYSYWHGTGADFLIGGGREVGFQLQEACSRHPSRFLRLLSTHWKDIPDKFRDDMLYGVAVYLAHRHGNLQANGQWLPVEEPDAVRLAGQILDELGTHPIFWHHNRTAAHALEACANVIYDPDEAERLVFLAISFNTLLEADPLTGNNVDHLSQGINMARGKVVEALMILANNFAERKNPLPELLIAALHRFARTEAPAISALFLRRLPYLQSKMFDLGWDLFNLAMQDANGLWKIAEPCLYYAYHDHFEVVEPLLTRIRVEGQGKDLETWGRISALAAMVGNIDFAQLRHDLNTLDRTEAWVGAAAVWTNSTNVLQHQEQCLIGIDSGLNAGGRHADAVATRMDNIFCEETALVPVPIKLIQRCFSIFESDSNSKNNRLFGFHEWLNATSQLQPEQALGAAEIYLIYLSRSKPFLYDHDNSLAQLLTRLFAEAEEREESDGGTMLQRVVVIQDTLLSMGVNGVADWLKAAERP